MDLPQTDRPEQEASNERRWSRFGSDHTSRRDWAAYLLAGAAIVGALSGLRASQLSSSATDDAALTTRNAEGRAAQLGATARWVFSTIGIKKVQQGVIEARIEALRGYAEQAGGGLKRSLLTRADALRDQWNSLYKLLRFHRDPYITTTLDGTYKFGEHLVERFSGQTQGWPELSALRERVSSQSDRAVATMSVSIVAAIAFLLGAIAEVVGRFRRPLVLAGSGLVLASLAALIIFEAWGVP